MTRPRDYAGVAWQTEKMLRATSLAPAAHAFERTPEEWGEALKRNGQPAYRGKQIFQWLHGRGVFDVAEMSNLPKSLRPIVQEELGDFPGVVHKRHQSSDRTRKVLVRFGDTKDVETVLIPQLKKDPDVDPADRARDSKAGLHISNVVTQCVSSQVGCAMGCVFCASGVAGLTRHLSASEIIAQTWLGKRELDEEEKLRNIVFMGMGEPLHNYDAVARALTILTHPEAYALSTRRVTVSTSGLIPEIERLGQDFEGKVQLAISLHAVTDEERSAIMPVNKKYPLKDLMACLRRYPLPKRRRITIEFTLIHGVNDSNRVADALAKLLRGVRAKVNLIPLNPISESPLEAPSPERVAGFSDRLRQQGVTATVRKQRGADVEGACGQLALYGPQGEKVPRKRRLPRVPS